MSRRVPPVTTLTLSSQTKATLFRIMSWRCCARSEHRIARREHMTCVGQMFWRRESANDISTTLHNFVSRVWLPSSRKRRSAASKTPGPLQMGDIGVTPTKEERNRLMTGSDIGGPGPSADTSVMAGSGSIYSPTKEQRGWIPISLKLAPAVWPTIALPHAIYRQRQVMPAAIRRPGGPGRQACR